MSDPKSAEPARYPKVLYVHDYRPDSRVTADLIRQMLLGFQPAKLEWWSCRRTDLYDQPDLCASRLHEFVIPNKLVPNVRLSGLKSLLVENLWVPLAARHLERVISETKPDLVAALLYGWSVPVLAQVRWPAGQKLHMSVWDFPDTNGMKKVIGENRGRRFVSAIHRLVRRADSFDAISTGMMAELQKQTGRRDGLVVHSGFEPKHLQALENAPVNQDQDGVVRLAYVGTIISETGFLNLLAALKNVRRTFPQKIVLEFFGGRNYRSRAWFEPDWMTEHGMFSDQGLVEALHRCSWGIVVMDPEGEDLRYSCFSFPNKAGTYLSAGVPILGFGHPECSLGGIMQEHHLGRFSSASSGIELEKFLAETLQLPSPRTLFRADILKCARTEFNAAELRARLWRAWGVQ